MEKFIDTWLEELADIPSGPDSDDNEDEATSDSTGNTSGIAGNYVVGADGTLQIDYLDLAQQGENNEISNLILNDDLQVICEVKTPEVNPAYEIQNEPMDVQFDEESEPLAQRLYKDDIKWYNNYYSPNQSDNFKEETGPLIDASTPIDVFSALFPDDLVDTLVFETNIYATQKGGGVIRYPTTKKEMKVFLGLNLLMGIKESPSYRDYWCSEADLRDDYISSFMPVNRFGWLLTHLHINNNSDMPPRDSQNYDKLYKIRPLLNKLTETYKACYAPSRYQSIDESMIPFKGRSGIKQYMPDKPTKRGYKVWVRADEKGYISQFQIYEGKRDGKVEKNLGQRVVTELTADLVNKDYVIFYDNFFNSVNLMIYLQQHKIKACGTTRSDRKFFPKECLPEGKYMSHGDYAFMSTRTGILALVWKDKRGIYFLSNYHNPNEVTEVNRKQSNGEIKAVPCPTLVKDYNAHMGYVDKADMIKSTYSIDRKSKKWWHRIFWHFLDTTVVNSFIIFSSLSEGKPLTLKDFRRSVSRALVGVPSGETRGKKSLLVPTNKFKPKVALELRFTENSHMPVRVTSRRCAQCSTKEDVHRSKWACETCGVALCLSEPKNCFRTYHQKD